MYCAGSAVRLREGNGENTEHGFGVAHRGWGRIICIMPASQAATGAPVTAAAFYHAWACRTRGGSFCEEWANRSGTTEYFVFYIRLKLYAEDVFCFIGLGCQNMLSYVVSAYCVIFMHATSDVRN